MNIKNILDKFVSNIIVYTSYTLIFLIWYSFFYNFGHDIDFLLIYFPFGIIILAFLFFGNKVIFGMLLSHITLYFTLKNYDLDLPFNNYFTLSLYQLICMPITLLALQRFNITAGVANNFKLDKTNIYHVLLITFLSVIVLGILVIFTSILYEIQINVLKFIIGNFFGGAVLIVSLKLIVNLPTIFKIFVKSS